MCAQDDDCRLITHRAQARDHVEPVEFRHPEIEDNYVRTMVDTQMNCLEAVRSFGNNSHARGFEKSAHASPDNGVIVSDEYTHEDTSSSARFRL